MKGTRFPQGLHGEGTLDEDDLELTILQRYIDQYNRTMGAGAENRVSTGAKCDRELSILDVVADLTGLDGSELDLAARQWLDRLAGPVVRSGPPRPLRRCSNGELRNGAHRFHARAYDDAGEGAWPAWDRVRELDRTLAARQPAAPVKEREQKFGILLSANQAERDFAQWAATPDVPVAALFIDIDGFKAINTRHGETKIDETVLPESMRLLEQLTRWRGGAYRHGGEEFVALLPNHDADEAASVAEKIRTMFERTDFRVDGAPEPVTVSIGVAIWPHDGGTYAAVLQAANQAEHEAKQSKNSVRVWRGGP